MHWRDFITPPFLTIFGKACQVAMISYNVCMYITHVTKVGIETGSVERGIGQEKKLC